MTEKKRVVVGLSGGVDSSVAAQLLIEQGYQVEGVYLECYNEPGCRTDQDKADALKVALKLGIPFQVLDFRKEYKEKVIEYFYAEYEAGRTPNPDVMCNREIKFGIFYDWALRPIRQAQGKQAQGKPRYDYVATGHYARIRAVPQLHSDTAILHLQRGRDERKDQSYFLWQIPQDHLEHILFPLGELLKSEVREIAKKKELLTADKPDSMGICFLGDVDTHKLLKDKLGENPGKVVMNGYGDTVAQCHVGTHKGLWFYTIGERGGFEIDKNKLKKLGMHPESMGPLYVIGKNVENNELVVGTREETMRQDFRIEKIDIRTEQKLWVRIRNLGELYEVSQLHSDTVTQQVQVVTIEPIFGVASGQSIVFYDEHGVLVGGSIIV